jgi:hypothetical protein
VIGYSGDDLGIASQNLRLKIGGRARVGNPAIWGIFKSDELHFLVHKMQVFIKNGAKTAINEKFELTHFGGERRNRLLSDE